MLPVLILVLLGLCLLLLFREPLARWRDRYALKLTQTQLWLAAGITLLVLLVLGLLSQGRLLIYLLPALLGLPFVFQRRPKSSAQPAAKVVETAWFRVEQEGQNAPMDAKVRQGHLAEKWLSTLGLADLVWLQQQIEDPESGRILQRFLDQEFPGWQERLAKAARDARALQMSPRQARDILGLPRDATRQQVNAAHKALLDRLPADKAGSSYLNVLLDKARKVLLEEHR